MCQFFSVDSDGKGKPYYFDAELRKQIRAGKLKDGNDNPITDADSHTSIAAHFRLNEDKCNKYEFRPLDEKFTIDQLNTTDDSAKIKRFCQRFDFVGLVPELIVKPIVHPWKIRNRKKITRVDLQLLKQWDSVRDSVRDSVWASVWDSVWASVGDSVWDSVRDSVRDSVWASVGAYTSSFFDLPEWKYIKHKRGKNPFQAGIDLWDRGLVPSFDGKMWRLHGPKGKILKEISKKNLQGSQKWNGRKP